MRLKAFDKELMQRVANGQTRGLEMIGEFNVDPTEFWKRVDQLVRKKWLVRDAQDNNTIRLGIEGYNEFVAKQKLGKPPTTRKARMEKREETTPAQKVGDLPKDAVELMQEAAKQARRTEKPKPHVSEQKTITQQPPAVKEKQEVRLPEAPSRVIAPPVSEEPEELRAPAATAEERCELCKAEFKLRAGDATRAVYGHCFCGAAYHQDCYSSISDEDGKCIRCGKRFKKHFSREAEEAMNKVKQLFD